MMVTVQQRGQITVYVLVGLVLLILLLLVFFLFRPMADEEITVPPEFQTVDAAVRSCLREVSVDALKRAAMHGGYVDPLDEELTGKKFILDPLTPTQSDLVMINPVDNESVIPYYFYLASPNRCTNCVISTLTPTKEEMERELAEYVKRHMEACIDFSQFPDFVIDASDTIEVTVTLNEQNVVVEYHRPIAITKDGTTETPTLFSEKIDIPFLRYYEMAIEMTQQEIDHQYLENYLLYLVATYGGMHQTLPPIGGYDESFSPHIWVLYRVQEEYRDILYSVTPSLRVVGTEGFIVANKTKDPYVNGFLKTTELDLLNDTDRGEYRVSFFYPDYPLFLDIKPREGQIIKPRSESQGGVFVIPARQQNYYNFYYDISAPFIVEIRDENAISGTDISFLFALEANVRENKNMAEWLTGKGTIPWSYDFVTFDVMDPQTGKSYDETLKEQGYYHNRSIKSMLCDPSLRTSPAFVRTVDSNTQKPLTGVVISYKCGFYGECTLGTTAADEFNLYAEYNGSFPPCIGGLLTAEKEGYASQTLKVSTRDGIWQQLPEISLDPIVTKRVVVELIPTKIQADQYGFEPTNKIVEFGTNDTVIVTFSRQGVEGEEQITDTIIFDNATQRNEIRLTPGFYDVTAVYMDGDGRTIKAGCQSVKGNDIPEEDVVIKPAPWGGITLTEETHQWYAPREKIYADNILVVPIFIAPDPRCLDDLAWMDAGKMFANQFGEKADPHFETG